MVSAVAQDLAPRTRHLARLRHGQGRMARVGIVLQVPRPQPCILLKASESHTRRWVHDTRKVEPDDVGLGIPPAEPAMKSLANLQLEFDKLTSSPHHPRTEAGLDCRERRLHPLLARYLLWRRYR